MPEVPRGRRRARGSWIAEKSIPNSFIHVRIHRARTLPPPLVHESESVSPTGAYDLNHKRDPRASRDTGSSLEEHLSRVYPASSRAQKRKRHKEAAPLLSLVRLQVSQHQHSAVSSHVNGRDVYAIYGTFYKVHDAQTWRSPRCVFFRTRRLARPFSSILKRNYEESSCRSETRGKGKFSPRETFSDVSSFEDAGLDESLANFTSSRVKLFVRVSLLYVDNYERGPRVYIYITETPVEIRPPARSL